MTVTEQEEPADSPPQRKLTRDLTLFVTAVGLLVYEVGFGGGRTPVLTALVSLLISPLVLRIDEARKKKVSPDE